MPNKQGFQSYVGKYILTFFAKNGQKLALFENVSDEYIKEKIDEGFRLDQAKQHTFALEETEVIVALVMDLSKETQITKIKFVAAKI